MMSGGSLCYELARVEIRGDRLRRRADRRRAHRAAGQRRTGESEQVAQTGIVADGFHPRTRGDLQTDVIEARADNLRENTRRDVRGEVTGVREWRGLVRS